jgi:DUF1365 family protein
MALLDLGELTDLDRRLRLFGHNRRRPLSFRDSDHVGVDALLRERGVTPPGGRTLLLTHCRIFGYVFNPVSFFYCYDRDDRLSAVVAEVNNTFGERHPYVLEVQGDETVWREKKVFHVSPFFRPDEGTYRWELPPPDETMDLRVDLTRAGSTVLSTALTLRRQPLTDRTLLRSLVRYPFMTLQVISAIHWQALRLWSKGIPVWTKPPYDPETARGGPA